MIRKDLVLAFSERGVPVEKTDNYISNNYCIVYYDRAEWGSWGHTPGRLTAVQQQGKVGQLLKKRCWDVGECHSCRVVSNLLAWVVWGNQSGRWQHPGMRHHSHLFKILLAVGKMTFRGWSGTRSWKSGGQTNLGALHWASSKVSTSEQKWQLCVADGETEAQQNDAVFRATQPAHTETRSTPPSTQPLQAEAYLSQVGDNRKYMNF